MPPTFTFILPGLNSSGPNHWQTHWEKLYGFTRIHQQDWDAPEREDWVHTINEILSPFPTENIILIAHSLACSTIAWWALRYPRPIRGALLVAPADTDAVILGTSGFTPMPLQPLPFPSITVASSNDPYVSLEKAEKFATAWHSRFIIIGAKGHINSNSNLGDWPEGYALLQSL